MSSARRALSRWIADGTPRPERASVESIEALRGVVERNAADAGLAELSADNRFGLAYEAGLLTAKMAIACSGHRVMGPAIHLPTGWTRCSGWSRSRAT